MPDQNTNTLAQASPTPAAALSGASKSPLSPWEDDLDPDDEAPKGKPAIIGSLDDDGGSASSPSSAPFVVPENVNEVGQKIPAQEILKNDPVAPVAPIANAGGVASLVKPVTTPAPANPVVTPGSPAGDIVSPSSAKTGKEGAPQFGWLDDEDLTPKPAVPVAAAGAAEAPQASNVSVPVPQPLAQPVQPQTPITPSVAPPVVSSPQTIMPSPSPAALPAEPVLPPDPTPSEPQMQEPVQKQGFLAKLRGKSASSPPPATQSLDDTENGVRRKVLLGIGILAAFFIVISALTEIGLLSVGAEKIYGAVGLQKLWGGLPSSSEGALVRSGVAMLEHPDYKAKGKISLTINSAVTSPVTDPLLAYSSPLQLSDQSLSIPIRATKTVSEAADYYITDPSTENTSDTETSEIDSEINTTTGDTSTSTGSSSSSSSTSTSPESSSVSSSTGESSSTLEATDVIKTLEADLSVKVSSDKSELSVKTEEGKEVRVINSKDKLYVKNIGSTSLEDTLADKYKEYTISSLSEEAIQAGIFKINTAKGLSIEGKRSGNEKIGSVRCYKYDLKSIELGDSLSSFGIESDAFESASGSVWIGIKDKLIKKISLKINAPSSSAITNISLSLELTDFDIKNSIREVSQSEIADETAAEQIGTDASSTAALTGDAKRKSDVKTILAALKAYKKENLSYPVSTNPLKLNAAGNIVETALVPKYINSLPSDANPSWYYGYQSDGKTCNVSARLESSTDSEGQIVGNVLLYFGYNND